MSREIKFRIWDKKEHVMDVPTAIGFDDSGKIDSVNTYYKYLWGDEFLLEQFTGLKDKDGKDIYEGDVLENPKYRSVVKFGPGIFYADVIEAVNRFPLAGEWQTSVVIGNAHSNPELLEAAK